MAPRLVVSAGLYVTAGLPAQALSQQLDARLKGQAVAALADQVRQQGDPQRGAVVFFTSAAACRK